MESLHFDDHCPKCHFHRMTAWNELTDEQKMLVERLPASFQFTPAERKKHRFCERCFHVDHLPNATTI